MLNRFKDAVKGPTPKNNGDESGAPHPPKPEKFCYSRPHFLGLNFEESSASRDFGLRPIMTPRNISNLPLQAGYAECINGGKSDFNEDQATATDLHLTYHFRTDVAPSCLDISLNNSLSHSGDSAKWLVFPEPSSPNLSLTKKPVTTENQKAKNGEIKASGNSTKNAEKAKTTEQASVKSDQLSQLSSEVEMLDFVSSPSTPTEKEPSINSHCDIEQKPKCQPGNRVHQQNHVKTKIDDNMMMATYFGLFDGHASHTVSLIVSKLLHMLVKEKLELCLGVIQRIKAVKKQSSTGTDVTVDQLVIGALEEAFIDMDDLLERESSTYHIKGGCTAMVALLFEGKLYVANAGDSRAILCHGDKITPVSQDFTAETEKQRLNDLAFSQPHLLHGEFTCYEFLHRVNKLDLGKHVLCRRPGRSGWTLKTAIEDDLKFPLVVGTGKRARIMGTIGVSRSLGDHDLYVYDSNIWIKPFLSPLPEVQVFDLTKDKWSGKDVLIMGSDGLWDVLSNKTAAEIVKNTFEQPVKKGNDKACRYTIAAQELIQEARGLFTGRGWRKKDDEMASFDDITVFVIPIKYYVEEWKKRQSDIDTLKKRQTDAEALKKRQTDAEALKKRQTDAEALKKRQTDAETLKKRQTDADTLKKKQNGKSSS